MAAVAPWRQGIYPRRGAIFNLQKQMETTIEQDLAATPTPKPINYAYKYGQLNGLLIMLEGMTSHNQPVDYIMEQIAYVAKRRQEIANGEDEQ